MLNLANPIYEKTATFGHFGRKSNEDGYFTWEKLEEILLSWTNFGLDGQQDEYVSLESLVWSIVPFGVFFTIFLWGI